MEEQHESKETSQEDRDQRVERLKQILQDRGEDVAKLVRTWLHKDD